MKSAFVVLLLAALLGGCSGIIVQPLTKDAAAGFHDGDGSHKSGYIVYEPTLYFTIGVDEKNVCIAGKPFVLPDYSRPYRIDSKRGLGKSGAEFTISDGWALGAFKDNSDNTAILAALLGAAGITADGKTTKSHTICPVGLYRMNKTTGAFEKVDIFNL